MHPKALRRLIELAPESVLYVSCNPKTLAQELPQWLQTYRLSDLKAFDLFPHTAHLETLVLLRRNAG